MSQGVVARDARNKETCFTEAPCRSESAVSIHLRRERALFSRTDILLFGLAAEGQEAMMVMATRPAYLSAHLTGFALRVAILATITITAYIDKKQGICAMQVLVDPSGKYSSSYLGKEPRRALRPILPASRATYPSRL